MAKYKEYEYVGKFGKKNYKKIVLLDKDNNVINTCYSRKINKSWYAEDEYMNEDIQIYGKTDVCKEKGVIFITNDEEDTELLNRIGFPAINFAHTTMSKMELMEYIPKLFNGFKKVFIINDFIENLRSKYNEILKQDFLEKLNNLPNINEIMILNPNKVHYSYKTINDILNPKKDSSKCEEEFMQLIKTAEKYK